MDSEEALRRLGRRIQALRRNRKLSRRVIAELAGIHENTLKALEGGQGNPTYRVLLKIADALTAELADLLRK